MTTAARIPRRLPQDARGATFTFTLPAAAAAKEHA